MNDLDAAAKGKLAERMVPVAAALACAVREECADSIGEVLEPFSRQELYGLLVVLAGMVPVDQPVGDLLSWVTWRDAPSLAGQPLPRSPVSAAERRQEYARLRSEGVSLEDAAERLSVSARTAERYEFDARAQQQEVA